MKVETQAGSALPHVGSGVGRRFLRVVSASASGSAQSDLSHNISRLDVQAQTGKMSNSFGHPLETPQKDSELIPFRAFEGVDAGADEARTTIAQARTLELAKANEALRKCLNGLISASELDNVLGQMLAGMSRQLGAVSSTLRIRNFEQASFPMELVFQDGQAMSPDEAEYPDDWQTASIDEQSFVLFLDQPTAITGTVDPPSLPEEHRSYLLGLGVKTILIIPLASADQVIGRLTFCFDQERDFHPEELEIARALATQASLVIQLTRLAQATKQSAVLEERNRLAREIHDSLTGSFAGIAMQSAVAEEGMAAGAGLPMHQIRLIKKMAESGLVEARRIALSLRSTLIEEFGLVEALQMLVKSSNVAGRLCCNFRCNPIPEEKLSPRIQHELLRIAQEAIGNAIHHGQPTVVTVTLRWKPPNLILQIKDNGCGIPKTRLEKSEGIGLRSMRERAAQIGAKLDIQTGSGHGTRIILTVPISL